MRPAAGLFARRMVIVMKTNDDRDRVIDVDFSGAKQKERRKTRKRRLVLLLAALLVALLLIGVALFFQLRQVTEDKSFWQNFNSQTSQTSQTA